MTRVKSWSKPKELPITLTGDRHTAKYLPDGRLFISFRCRTAIGSKLESLKVQFPTKEIIGWVGTYDDIMQGKPGQYVIKIADNTKNWDTLIPRCRNFRGWQHSNNYIWSLETKPSTIYYRRSYQGR